MSSRSVPSSFLGPWKQTLESCREEQLDDFPNYHMSRPESLVTTCTPKSIIVGHGAFIYKTALLPAILEAKHEVILVTCFWAESETHTALRETLAELIARRRELIERSGPDGYSTVPRLTIRLCFSSRSLFQKLFHPWSRDGYVYPASACQKLGLPSETAFQAARIDVRAKSLFFLPFSVMHPKFLVVDRQRAWMPSCNISWETWFEGCVEFDGPAVAELLRFYSNVWDRDGSMDPRVVADAMTVAAQSPPGPSPDPGVVSSRQGDADTSACRRIGLEGSPECPAVMLPSSHHQNPRFRYAPFSRRSTPPATPLNTALLSLFAAAQRQIDVLTPNLTCEPVVSALLGALRRGVDVRIRTSRNIMLMEQLVTAFTTTEWTLRSLIKQYKGMCKDWDDNRSLDLESLSPAPGRLDILYYRPNPQAKAMDDPQEPVVTHFKMTLVDGEYLVLGSGNLDRASWYTSQELGILLHLPGFQHDVWTAALETRMEYRFRGSPDTEDRSTYASERRFRYP